MIAAARGHIFDLLFCGIFVLFTTFFVSHLLQGQDKRGLWVQLGGVVDKAGRKEAGRMYHRLVKRCVSGEFEGGKGKIETYKTFHQGSGQL